MAEIVAKRLVEHLERAGFVVMKRPTDVGAPAAATAEEMPHQGVTPAAGAEPPASENRATTLGSGSLVGDSFHCP
jgi:hypothetical protein